MEALFHQTSEVPTSATRFAAAANAALLDNRFTCEFGQQRIDARVEQQTHRAFSIARIQGERHRASRRRQHAAHPAPFVMLQVQGTSRCTNGPERIDLREGDGILIDPRRDLDFEFSNDLSIICFRMSPEDGFGRLLDLLRSGMKLDGRNGLGRMAFEALRGLAREAQGLSDNAQRDAIDAAAMLMRGALFEVDAPADHRVRARDIKLARLKAAISRKLADAEVDMAAIAGSEGITLRYMSMLFSGAGTSPSRYLWTQRLEKCREDLTDERMDGISLTEIAHHWGFKCSAHFSRSFRQAYGISPSAFRADRARMDRAN